MMDSHSYKVKLTNGRIIGPLNLSRIKLFIMKEQIIGLETARVYPEGEWKDINQFPEIAEILMSKLEGKLVQEKSGLAPAAEEPNEPSIEAPEEISEKTILVPEQDLEKTTMVSAEERLATSKGPAATTDQSFAQLGTSVSLAQIEIQKDPAIAQERTAVFVRPTAAGQVNETKKGLNVSKKHTILIVLAALLGLFFLMPAEQPKQEPPFKVEMPVPTSSPDPGKAEEFYQKGLGPYSEDTVEGYKKAARSFIKAISLDPNNVKALCLLASSYMNLIDVVARDENYFSVVTKLVDLARAKGMELSELVIADAELFNMLGNPDSAFNRIVEYSKIRKYGPEMFYYLAYTLYLKGQNAEALKYLGNIDPSQFFSQKIPFLYGLLFEKEGQADEAIKAYRAVLTKSTKHIKARIRLAENFFHKDNLTEVSKHVDFIIAHQALASREELARAYYLRARVLIVAKKDEEAVQDLQTALKSDPENIDIKLEYYTLRARLGAVIKDAPGKAKMFHYLAEGERALKEARLNDALAAFLTARDAQYNDATPLLRLADVFRKKGDIQSAKVNLEKAIKISPRNVVLYPKYIKVLIDAYEFEEATKNLEVYKGLDPPLATFDQLQGDLNFKQDKVKAALAWYKRALSASNIEVYVSYATAMLKVNSFPDAAFYFGLALRLDPLNVEATIGLARALAEIHGVEKGVEYIRSARERSPYKAALSTGLAEVSMRKSDFDSALKYTAEAVAVDPTYAAAYKVKAETYNAMDKTKEALDTYKVYIGFNSLDPVGYLERYKIFLKKLDLKSAKDELLQVIANYPKYPGIYYMLGEVYDTGQNFDAALDAASQEIKVNPSYMPAYALAGKVYNLKKDYQKALELLTRAMGIDSNFVPVLLQASTANQMLKSYSAAQAMLERAVFLDQGNPQVHKRIGVLYWELGNKLKAKEHLQQYLNLMPDASDRADIERYLR